MKVSHSLRFESIADWQKIYEINPKFELYANPDKGTGLYLGLNFNRVIDPTHSFTMINGGDYEEKSHLFSVTNGFSFGQQRNDRQSFSYNLYFNSNNQPTYHLEAYSVSIRWNHLLYRRILDYQVTPHIVFTEDEHFSGRPGINLDMNLHF